MKSQDLLRIAEWALCKECDSVQISEDTNPLTYHENNHQKGAN